MQKSLTACVAAAGALVLLLGGCAAPSDEDVARDECQKSAIEQLGDGVSDIDMSEIETMNFSEALFDLGGDTLPDDGHLYTVSGDFTFRTSDATHKATMVCTVTMENGAPAEPVEAAVVDPRD